MPSPGKRGGAAASPRPGQGDVGCAPRARARPGAPGAAGAAAGTEQTNGRGRARVATLSGVWPRDAEAGGVSYRRGVGRRALPSWPHTRIPAHEPDPQNSRDLPDLLLSALDVACCFKRLGLQGSYCPTVLLDLQI